MKQFLLILSLSLVAVQGQKSCSISEVTLTARDVCAGRCTAYQKTCGGGNCEVLSGGGTGLVDCICEAGYKQTPAKTLCVPDCSTVQGCNVAGGSCDAPGICNCKAEGTYFENKKCVSKPECEGDCYGKICDASGCKCDEKSYEAVDGKCKRKCINECDAAKGLECVEPGVCACIDKTKNINADGVCDTVYFVTTPAAETTPAKDTTPSPEDTTPAEETTPSAEDTTPAEETTPSDEDTTPAEETTPSDEDTTPAEETTPSDEDTTPAEETTPAGETTTPSTGLPAECDICAKLEAIEKQNKKIDALLALQ